MIAAAAFPAAEVYAESGVADRVSQKNGRRSARYKKEADQGVNRPP